VFITEDTLQKTTNFLRMVSFMLMDSTDLLYCVTSFRNGDNDHNY